MGNMAKVMISIPDDLLSEIDKQAKAEHRKRSEWFKELARHYLAHVRHVQKREFGDLEFAAATSTDFWENTIDDKIWNID